MSLFVQIIMLTTVKSLSLKKSQFKNCVSLVNLSCITSPKTSRFTTNIQKQNYHNKLSRFEYHQLQLNSSSTCFCSLPIFFLIIISFWSLFLSLSISLAASSLWMLCFCIKGAASEATSSEMPSNRRSEVRYVRET